MPIDGDRGHMGYAIFVSAMGVGETLDCMHCAVSAAETVNLGQHVGDSNPFSSTPVRPSVPVSAACFVGPCQRSLVALQSSRMIARAMQLCAGLVAIAGVKRRNGRAAIKLPL